MAEVRYTMQELAEKYGTALTMLHGRTIEHRDGARYMISGVSLRADDMEVLVSYTPIHSIFHNAVIFTYTESDMDFGNRFRFV